jgi:rubrerythrin
VAENHHSERYQKLLREVENGTVFKKEEEVY